LNEKKMGTKKGSEKGERKKSKQINDAQNGHDRQENAAAHFFYLRGSLNYWNRRDLWNSTESTRVVGLKPDMRGRLHPRQVCSLLHLASWSPIICRRPSLSGLPRVS
jgi:hypothetical protein